MPRNWFCIAWVAVITLWTTNVDGARAADDKVARGEYLARAGDCISCHTAASAANAGSGPGRQGPPFAGGLAIATPYGTLITPNITPDKETGIGAWSADDFWRVLHFGVNKRGEPLYPAMPYVFFTKVTREDSDAIFAYLQSLKPVRHEVDVNQLRWPFDMRFAAMTAWQTLYFTPGVFQPSPDKSSEWNRGAYLVEGLGHCGACHTPRNFMGAVEPSERFTGASIDSWFAPNITPNIRHGIGQYTVEELTQFFRKGVMTRTADQFANAVNVYGFSSRQSVEQLPSAVGPMAEVWHNSLRFLTEDDAKAMAIYLKSLPAATSPLTREEGTVQPYRLSVGARLFLENCSGCHMPNGSGAVGAAPPLVNNPMVIAPSPDNLLSMILGGQVAQHGMGGMPNFKMQFTNAEVAAVATYVRTAWGNAAPPVTAAQVGAFRQSYFPSQVPQ
jgi:mono/diheme cytochrome c family protein